ncbi:MAG: hypothetical protein LBJ94_01300 [Puniceicoccales bacterium]|jgi:hypothetical protein|nr:hypothetical protein [Puniceicoccales bacterium]
MSEMKITSATYVWVDSQTPGVELGLEFSTQEGPQRAVARVGEVGPVLFNSGLVPLRGKSMQDREILDKYLPPKELRDFPGEMIGSVTDDPRVMKIIRHVYNAADNLHGARFRAGNPLPEEFLQNSQG